MWKIIPETVARMRILSLRGATRRGNPGWRRGFWIAASASPPRNDGAGFRAKVSILSVPVMVAALLLSSVDFAAAHHVLGRPASSLSDDSNTPPGLQVETRVGDFLVTYMAFPAFPKPGAPGRINLYVTGAGDGTPFQGDVTFKARGDTWLWWLGVGGAQVKLGVQPVDYNVFRQRYLFGEAGDYIITAEFEANGEFHSVDFPLRIGEPSPLGPIGVAVILLVAVLAAVSIIQRRRVMTGKVRGAHGKRNGKAAS